MANVQGFKVSLRSEIRAMMKKMSVAFVDEQSSLIFENVRRQDFYKQAKCVSVFLSMPAPVEVQTFSFVKQCFEDGKRVYVPKVTGSNRDDMKMIHVNDFKDIQTWPLSKWKIREPPVDYYVNKETDTDALESSKIELVIVPGVAFSRQKYRLGQGKGYYDTFFQKIYHRRQQINLKPPVLVGVALDEQIVDNVPVEEHDYTLDHVVTPSGIV